MKSKLMLARFPGMYQEHPKSSNYIRKVFGNLHPTKLLRASESDNSTMETWSVGHSDISEVVLWDLTETPIDMARNRCVAEAKKEGCDYILMIDADMAPDQPRKGAKPFWDVAWPFLFRRAAPALIAAPYVGPGWHQNIYVFLFRNFHEWSRSENFSLQQFTREEAAQRSGIEKVAALPTGLILMDVRVDARLGDHPLFYYEMDDKRTKKLSTEDVTFTRDVSLAWHDVEEAGCYCAWDSWARHVKLTEFGAPEMLREDAVGAALKNAWDKNRNERLVVLGDDESSGRLQYFNARTMIDEVRRSYPDLLKTVREE